MSNFLLLIKSGFSMYFYRMADLFDLELLSLTICLISLKSLVTIIPHPLFVSSPGFIIQTFCIVFYSFTSSS